LRVLCVAAHPDDEVLGVGGTLLRHVRDGDAVSVLIACSELDLSLRMDAARLMDAKEVALTGGWELAFGGLSTLSLDPSRLTAIIEAYTATADVVYTHHADLNRDHRAVLEAVTVATRPWVSRVSAVRCFNTPSASELGAPFTPNHFVAIDIEAKARLLAIYGSELRADPHPRSEGGIRAHADFYGRSAGLSAAEPFVTLWERR